MCPCTRVTEISRVCAQYLCPRMHSRMGVCVHKGEGHSVRPCVKDKISASMCKQSLHACTCARQSMCECVLERTRKKERKKEILGPCCISCACANGNVLRVQHETQLEQKDVSRENSDARLSKEGSENQ